MLATKLSIVIYPKGYKCNISASNNAEVKTSKLYVHSHLIDIYFLHLKTDDMIPIVTQVLVLFNMLHRFPGQQFVVLSCFVFFVTKINIKDNLVLFFIIIFKS